MDAYAAAMARETEARVRAEIAEEHDQDKLEAELGRRLRQEVARLACRSQQVTSEDLAYLVTPYRGGKFWTVIHRIARAGR